jgi:hypothetical protein
MYTSPKQPSHYRERVEALNNIVRHCIAVSRACAGISAPTPAHYYASVLFTSLCTRGVSLAILAPHSPWAKKEIDQWDFASAAGIVRSILEVRLAFFYLCVESVSAEEWACRWNLFNLHDCTSRIRLFKEIPSGEQSITGFLKQAKELRQRLAANAFFLTLPPKQQKRLLSGRRAYLLPLENIAERARVDLHWFRLLYRLFSAQVHALPLSFYRMGEQNRGRGVHSEAEEGYMSLCLSFAVTLLVGTRDEMKTLFPQAKDI